MSNAKIEGAVTAPTSSANGTEPERLDLGLPLVLGVAVITVFFGIFLGWAVFAPLESAAIAQGEVGVDIKRKTIQHLEGGIVGGIFVRDGDVVEKGEILIQLDKTPSLANLALLLKRANTMVAQLDRLSAERDGKTEIMFRDELEQQRTDDEVIAMLKAQTSIFNARGNAKSGKHAILDKRIAQFDAEIIGIEADIKTQDERIALSDDEIDANQILLKKGLVGKQRLFELQKNAATVRGQRSQNLAAVARVQQSIAETQLEMSELEVTHINEVVEEMSDVQTELYDLREQVRVAEDILMRTEIRAPIAGTVVGHSVHTIGGIIAPGEPLLDIVPTNERLIIETRVDPKDIDVVEPNLTAHVRFTAFSQRNTQPVDARVVTVSADRLEDERTGEPYYLARIELIGDIKAAMNGEELYPGMQAEVMIVTGTRTPLDYFFRPITQSLNRAFREQ